MPVPTTLLVTNKCTRLVAELVLFLSEYGRDEVKTMLGDSTNNNRTLTVNQVIRFLTTRRNPIYKNLGYSLQVAYDKVYENILNSRSPGRSDAVDINEFFTYFVRHTMPAKSIYGQRLVRSLSQQLTI